MSSVKTIGGITPRELGMAVLRQSQRPMLPSTRDRTLMIPGRNGEWDFGADMEPRLLGLECAFAARNSFELQHRVESLARLLVDAYGRPRTVELIFEVHPDRTYYVRYSGSIPVERAAGLGRFLLPLTAFDPYATGLEQVFETTVTASPFVTSIQSLGEIRTPPVVVLINQGPTTITHFRIENEYQVE